MPKIQLAALETAADLAPFSSLISEALLASLFAATLLAELTAARYPGLSFAQRFAYAFWRYALPGCLLSGVVYWLLWRRTAP